METNFLILPSQRIRVKKTWGYEDWLWNGEYCGKRLVFDAGKYCSWHYHQVKDEVLYVAKGMILMEYSWQDDLDFANRQVMDSGSAFHVPTGLRHRMTALEASELFEVSTHHEDSDSIRLLPGSPAEPEAP